MNAPPSREVARSGAPANRRRPDHHRRGAAVVEFAAVAPVLFLLIFGMIEFGRMVMVQQVLTNASREGARVGILEGTTQSEIKKTVKDYLAAANIKEPDIDSVFDGDRLSVTVSVNFDQVTWLPAPIFLGGRGLSATTVMRLESTQ